MKLKILLVIVASSALIAYPVQAAALNPYLQDSTGFDVSWPNNNCVSTLARGAAWGIVGATGGLNFHTNPCLPVEAAWFKHLSLYSNTGYAGLAKAQKYAGWPRHCATDDENCLAYNWGYNAGKYAVKAAAQQNIHASMWWLDVEIENSWSETNVLANRASIQGMADAIERYVVVVTIGIYSYPGQWDKITGSWRPGHWPSWVATGTYDRATALAWCTGHDFTGGGTWLTQYIEVLDRDYACPPSY
ncbi:MAG TPA: hypothetical protein VMY99_05040 [Nevskiaceae bacterium]|nr:hypothetical protein [Nevskiaceae bacterium]